jgi:predicted transcriptional regulator of viral defense system
MNLVEALTAIKSIDRVAVSTHDVAVYLKIELTHASKILQRLTSAGQIIKLKRGLWAINDHVEPMLLLEKLTDPYPAYISLQTALYYHGMISQIPSVIYGVSLARTKRISTPLATYSIHHITPDLFFGFENTGPKVVKMATMEKALFDLLYFSRVKSRLFSNLNEIEIPEKFSTKVMMAYVDKITETKMRSVVMIQVEKLINFPKKK